MKIDCIKNTWVREINADFIREGFWAGTYAISIDFAGGDCPNDDVMAEILSKVRTVELSSSSRIVRFTGLFNPKDADMRLFVHSLKNYGFSVQIIVPSSFSAEWLDKFDWVIIRNDRDDIVLHNANEIWHCPRDTSVLKEPTLPLKPGLLYLTKGRSLTETVKFITSSKYLWRLL